MKKSGKKLIVTCHDVSHIAYGKIVPGKAPKWWQDALKHRWTWNPMRNGMIRSYLKSADHILTVSDALKTELASHNFPPMQTVHNGIDLNFWKPSVTKADARKKLNLPADKFLFLLAGRMGYDKGSTLIAATLPNEADLVLAGDRFSNEFAAVKDRMHIFYNQTAEEMKLQYAAADVVLVPSRCLDCFPTVCLEAMAMERPVMATSWGGAKESVLDGLTGWILDPMDERAWQQKMLWCLKNSADCVQTGLAGRKRMQEYFGLPMMLEKLEKIYAL
jgi:glycosyltransferase involved in cell wall biosynthesis